MFSQSNLALVDNKNDNNNKLCSLLSTNRLLYNVKVSCIKKENIISSIMDINDVKAADIIAKYNSRR